MDLCHLETTFVEINNFPGSVVKRIISQIQKDITIPTNLNNNSADQITVEEKIIQCTLPYACKTSKLPFGAKIHNIVQLEKKHDKL